MVVVEVPAEEADYYAPSGMSDDAQDRLSAAIYDAGFSVITGPTRVSL